jgi:hypothetical protein
VAIRRLSGGPMLDGLDGVIAAAASGGACIQRSLDLIKGVIEGFDRG